MTRAAHETALRLDEVLPRVAFRQWTLAVPSWSRLLLVRARRLHRTNHPMTLKEWGDLPDDVPGELLDGRLEDEELTTPSHDALAGYLFAFFYAWADPRGGLVFVPDRKYAVTTRRGRKPDVSVFFPGRQFKWSERVTTTPPDIAIEVITATLRDTRRDRVDKAREYAKFGVRWYWLVDPAVRTIEILRLGRDRKYVLAAAGTDGRLPVPGCRGLVLNLDELWRRLDRAEQ